MSNCLVGYDHQLELLIGGSPSHCRINCWIKCRICRITCQPRWITCRIRQIGSCAGSPDHVPDSTDHTPDPQNHLLNCEFARLLPDSLDHSLDSLDQTDHWTMYQTQRSKYRKLLDHWITEIRSQGPTQISLDQIPHPLHTTLNDKISDPARS